MNSKVPSNKSCLIIKNRLEKKHCYFSYPIFTYTYIYMCTCCLCNLLVRYLISCAIWCPCFSCNTVHCILFCFLYIHIILCCTCARTPTPTLCRVVAVFSRNAFCVYLYKYIIIYDRVRTKYILTIRERKDFLTYYSFCLCEYWLIIFICFVLFRDPFLF